MTPFAEQLFKGEIHRRSAYARDYREEHRLGTHMFGREGTVPFRINEIGARENEECKERRNDRAAVDRLRVRLYFHIRAAYRKGHIDGQCAEGRLVYEGEHVVDELSESVIIQKILICGYREGRDDKRERPDDQNGYHIDKSASYRADYYRLLRFLNDIRKCSCSFHLPVL